MSNSDHHINTGVTLDIATQITIAIVILNFALFIFILVLYFRAKGFRAIHPSRRRSNRLIFASYEPSLPRRALDLSILNALPITVFKSEDFAENGGLECAVCISELTDGEEVRLLPKCHHGFHVECIDMWFCSNSTCPLCRIPVSAELNPEFSLETLIPELEVVSDNGHSLNVPISPYSNEVGSSSSSSSSSSGKNKEGMLVIDIPRRKVDGFSTLNSPLPLSRLSPSSPLLTSRGVSDQGMKSPRFGRMKSMRRILSRGNGKGVSSSFSPRGCDDVEEQGAAVASKCQ